MTEGPPPTRAIHIGGTNNINILVYKQSGTSTVKLSDSEANGMKVSMGCPDKGFFVGQKKLVTSTDFTSASYNNILDCNYIVNAEPNDKSSVSFYDDFLMPAQKQVPAIAGVTVTTSIIFGVPNASSTLMVTGGVSGQVAFMQAYSADFMSFSPVFANADCTGNPGFTATGTGWACLNLKSGQNWNFTVMGGEMGNSGNFTGVGGAKYWPPTIPSVYIASAGHTNLGPYAYVMADKNLIVNIKKAGTDVAVENACIGVKRSGGGMFMGPQDMTCGIGSKTFKVPLGSITVQVGLPGFGQPQEYPIAILDTTTTKNIYVAQPTTYISVTVLDSAGNEINGAPIFAHGNGFGQGMTGSTGTTTIYVAPGVYVVEGFAPGLGQITSQTVTVPGSGGVAADLTVNTALLGTVVGRVFTDANANSVYDGGDTPLSGVQIGAHRIDGTNGGNGTQTDSSGNYTLYLPAGTYEIGGWSSDVGGFQADDNRIVTTGGSSTLNVPLQGQGTLYIEIQNASTISPLFAGVFDPTTGRGNGTDSWTTSGTSKIANLTLSAGTYEFHVGSPVTGELNSSSTILTAGNTNNIIIDANAVSPLVTISGNVASSSTGIANATVWASKTGGGPGNFSTQTDTNGDYSLLVPQNSSYRIGAKILGYIVSDVSTSTATSNITVDFALVIAGGTISGHIINASSTAISNAWVSAKKIVDAGQMDVWTGGPTDGNGSFSLGVDSGDWTVFAEAPCYQRSAGVTSTIDTVSTTTLSAISGCVANVPEMQGFTPTTGGQMANGGMSLDIPANALGTGSATVSLSVVTTTPRTAPNATALANSVQSITASDSTGQSITTLNNSVSLSITYSESDLPTGFAEGDLQLGYFDETTGQWETVASTVDIVNNIISASISHFTDYGPILPNVPTAPTGLTATVASTTGIDLSWTASSPVSADYYIIYASTTALTDFATSTQIATTTGISYSHTGLDASATWYYKVAGYNTNGEGWNSDRANATTEAGSCSTLTGAATYNAYPTCGAATCSSGYTLSGSGAGATCTANQTSGGGNSSDTTPPTNTSVTIASGATSTASTVVSLTLGATSASHMMISNVSTFTGGSWETYATSKTWTLTSGVGTKTVYVKFKDTSGNISTAVSDSIALVMASSTITISLPATGGDASFSLNVSTPIIINNSSHTITVSSATVNNATVTIQSQPVTVSLVLNIAQSVDTDGNSKNDLQVTYLGLDTNNKPKLKFVVLVESTLITTPTSTADSIICPLAKKSVYKAVNSASIYYITSECTKRAFNKSNVFFTYFNSWNDVQTVSSSVLSSIVNDSLGFMPWGPKYDPKYGALVKTVTDPKVYLLLGTEKYWINSEAVFNSLKYSWNWIEDVDMDLLSKYTVGSEINYVNHHPNYTIVKYPNDTKVYRLEPDSSDSTKQVRRHIKDENAFNAFNFRWDRIVTISSDESYDDGEQLSSSLKTNTTVNSVFTLDLEVGDSGVEVEQLQQKLINLGYLDVSATGYFGQATKEAVKKYQTANGINTTGNVGPLTRGKLNSL